MIMLATAALLPALTLAFANVQGETSDTPVIQDATAESSDGHVATEITTTLPLFREDVRVKMDGKTLVVYLQGAIIDGGKRTFGEGEGAIRALPRASYAKLEIPTPAGATCRGPASIEINDTITRVSMSCSASAAVTGSGVAAAAAAVAGDSEAPARSRREARESRKAEALATKLGAIAPAAEPAKAPLPVIEATAAPAAAAPAAKTEAAAPAAKIEAAAPAPLAITAAAPAPLPKAEAPVGPLPAEKTSPFVAFGGIALVGIMGYLIWRKRQGSKFGMIRILETASLGPKRALVVAEIDGQKMILGTSEAGISVLNPAGPAGWNEQTIGGTRIPMPIIEQAEPADSHEPTLTGHAVTRGPRGFAMAGAVGGGAAAIASPAAFASADIEVENENEGGLLARLFRRNQMVEEEDVNLGSMEDEFRDLLADSIEDEELRRRLQAGLGGRTS